MRRQSILLLVVLAASIAVPLPGRAATTIEVHPASLSGWSSQNTGASMGTFVQGPGAPPGGSGSFRQTAPTPGDRQVIRTAAFNGTPLASITTLTYATYVSSYVSGQATAIVLRVDNDGNGSTDDSLTFEPVYQNGTYPMVPGAGPIPNQCPGITNCAALGTWQTWNARIGGWWAASAMTIGPPLDTLAHYQSVHPGTKLATDQPAFVLSAGSGWTNFDGAVDIPTVGVSGSDTTYDFEASPAGLVVVYPFDMGDWSTSVAGGGTGTFVTGPGSVPSGLGSFRQQTPAGGDRHFAETSLLNTRLLSDIHALGYSTYVSSAGSQATTMQLLVDLNGDGVHTVGIDDTLTFEPTYQHGGFAMVPGAGPIPNQCGGPCTPTGAWKTWDADAGGWWSRLAGTSGPPLDTLAHYAATHPGARVITAGTGLKMAVGSSDATWAGFEGSFDAVRVDGIVYDFEPSSFAIDCDVVSNDIAAIQNTVNLAPNNSTITLKGTCDFSAAPAHGGDITSITNTAVLIRPGAPVDGLTIKSAGAPQSATIVGSGIQTAFAIGPDNDDVTITGLRFLNLARPIVAVNTDGTTIGALGSIPNPAANRIIGNGSMNSAILGLAVDRMPFSSPTDSITIRYGTSATPFTWTGQSAGMLTNLQVLGNYISYDPPAIPDGSATGTVAIDVRQRSARIVDGVTVEGNAVGMFSSEFPSLNMNGVLFHSLTPLGVPVGNSINDYYIRNVTVEANNLGRLEELPNPVADIHAAGRIGIYLVGVGGFDINDNGVRARGSTTGIPMPHGGIVVSDSGFGEIAGNGVNVLADPSTVDSGLGAIGVVDEIGALFNGSVKPQPSTRVLVRNNTLGTIDPNSNGVNQRGIVVNGSSLVTVRSNIAELTTEDAINIGALVQGPGDLGNPGPVDLPRTVTASAFCNNTLDGTLDDPNEVSFDGGASSTANSFPGGAGAAGNGECVAPAALVVPSGGTTAVAEGGATDNYTLRLTFRPASNVTITPTPNAQLTVSPASVTFTPFNWHVAQTVTVSAVDDTVVEGGHTGSITHTASSADTSYNALPVGGITAAITDNDTGAVIIAPAIVNVAEGGANATYSVSLGAAPPGNVTVNALGTSQAGVSPTSVTFTPLTWNVPQAITVTAVDDSLRENAHLTTINHTTSSAVAAWNAVVAPSVLVQIADNDPPLAPVISRPSQNEQIAATNVIVSGFAEPGATVEVYEGMTLLGTTTAGPNGSWSLALTFTPDTHSIHARQVTVDLQTSPNSPLRTFVVDTTPPNAPVINSPAANAILTSCPVTVSGTAEPGSQVVVSNNGMAITSTVANSSGQWSVTLPCAAGSFNVTAVAYDAARNVSPSSGGQQFTLVLPAPPVIITPAQGSYQPASVLVSGTGVAGSIVRLFEGSSQISQNIPVDGAGNWSATLSFSEGPHTIRARTVIGSTAGDFSASRSFTVDAGPPTVRINRPSGYILFHLVPPGQTPSVSGTARDGVVVDRIEVTYIDALTGSVVATSTASCTGCGTANATWTDSVSISLPTLVRARAVAYDAVGNVSIRDEILMLASGI